MSLPNPPPLAHHLREHQSREPHMQWHAIVYYPTEIEGGLNMVEHDLEELYELHDLVEKGPNFYAIDRIEIRINPIDALTATLTIEQALRL